MKENMKIQNYASSVSDAWHRGGMDISQYVQCVLYILCLKKMIEENACVNPSYMPSIIELTKVLYRPISPEDVEVIRRAVPMLEDAYKVKPGLLDDVILSFRYEDELWRRAFLDVVAITSNIVVDEEGYGPYAEYILSSVSKQAGRMADGMCSSNAVSDLLALASNVQDGEAVFDGTIGYGYSAVKVVKGHKDVKLYGVDYNRMSTQIATLYMILNDVDFEVDNGDFTTMDFPHKFDKVAMDIPFGMRSTNELVGNQLFRARRWMDTESCKEMECLFMASALDAMKEDGRFVVIVPQGILFKQTKALSTFRKKIVQEGLLKAVVSLPPVYNSTMINTAMLVFERNNKEVLFVDATSLIQRERRNDAYITEENQNILHEMIEEKKALEGISFIVPNEEIISIGDWSISKYINVEDSVEYRAINEINVELDESYKRLQKLINITSNIELFS